MHIIDVIREIEELDHFLAEETLRMENLDFGFEHVSEDCQCDGKRCPHCGKLKCHLRFYRNKHGKLASWCRKCTSDQTYFHKTHPEQKRQSPDIKRRLLSRVDIQPGQCWNWTGRIYDGYGILNIYQHGKKHSHPFRVHRISYELFRGPIPEGMVIDHLCCNRRCVNPDHLEVVTMAENTRRGNIRRINARKNA